MTRARGWKIAAVAALVLACDGSGDRSGGGLPTAPSPFVLAGSYVVKVRDSCGGRESGLVDVTGSGEEFQFLLPSSGHLVTGTLRDGFVTLSVDFAQPCSGSASGTARLDAIGALEGEYTGRSIFCCDPVAGRIELAPEPVQVDSW
ncbi:MAG: hypothetical protein NDJ75_01325 [Thermoanaerobaculia bacterium]|nr:hypothetical protein [Thermoanaerobaculia bacterium]